jgi:hypothetical protein
VTIKHYARMSPSEGGRGRSRRPTAARSTPVTNRSRPAGRKQRKHHDCNKADPEQSVVWPKSLMSNAAANQGQNLDRDHWRDQIANLRALVRAGKAKPADLTAFAREVKAAYLAADPFVALCERAAQPGPFQANASLELARVLSDRLKSVLPSSTQKGGAR